jgi:hypothetical protein
MPEVAPVAVTGDHLATLRALRDTVAAAIDSTGSARDLAALSRQLTDILARIAEAEGAAPQPKGNPLDEVNARRAEREARRTPRGAVPARRKGSDG